MSDERPLVGIGLELLTQLLQEILAAFLVVCECHAKAFNWVVSVLFNLFLVGFRE